MEVDSELMGPSGLLPVRKVTRMYMENIILLSGNRPYMHSRARKPHYSHSISLLSIKKGSGARTTPPPGSTSHGCHAYLSAKLQ